MVEDFFYPIVKTIRLFRFDLSGSNRLPYHLITMIYKIKQKATEALIFKFYYRKLITIAGMALIPLTIVTKY